MSLQVLTLPWGLHREGFKHIVSAGQQLVKILMAVGPEVVVDMDNLLSRESMDVIGEMAIRIF